MRYLIVGNGVAGVTAALTLRQRDPAAHITLLSGESDYFFSRTALMYAFMDRMSLRDLEPYERGKWKELRIELIRGWASDIDASRHELRLRDGRTLPYDRLLLATGSRARRPAWAGLDAVRSGLVNFVTLSDLERCEEYTPSTREAVVVGGGLIGVELVECLLHHGRRVSFLVKDPFYWPAALGGEEADLIHRHLRSHGVDLHLDQAVTEVLSSPDGRVRAVRTQQGREFPCQLLGVAIGVEPQIDWLRATTTPPALARGILVSPDFRTSLPDVFAAGDCAEIERPGQPPLLEQIWYSAKRQGEAAARSLLGDTVNYQPPLFFNSAKFFDIEYTTVGQVNDAPAAAQHFFWRHPAKEASLRLVHLDGALIGANLLGARWNHTLFETWIHERRSLDYCFAQLPAAQFDVEFGRLDLRPLYAQLSSRERSRA